MYRSHKPNTDTAFFAKDALFGLWKILYNKGKSKRNEVLCMWLIKLPFKILALPLMLVMGTIAVLGKFTHGIAAFVIGLGMFLLFIGGVITAFQGNWPMVGVVFVLEVICFAAMLAMTVLVELAEQATGSLLGFIFS